MTADPRTLRSDEPLAVDLPTRCHLNWPTPWSGQTPFDIAEQAGRSDVVAWLLEKGATRGKKSA